MPTFSIAYPLAPVRRSLACNTVMDLFGLAYDEPELDIARNVEISVAPGEVVLFTGPSGSGKSSLLRAVAKHYAALDAGALSLPEVPLIDAFTGPVEQRLEILSACGLAEAAALLRTPQQLSDGQRYRFRLAYALAQQPAYLALDEFAALLDRPLARVLAFNLRKRAERTGTALLLATANADDLDELQPHQLIQCRGAGAVEVMLRNPVKKNTAASPKNYGSVTVPEPTGRTSLGGITAATASASSNVS